MCQRELFSLFFFPRSQGIKKRKTFLLFFTTPFSSILKKKKKLSNRKLLLLLHNTKISFCVCVRRRRGNLCVFLLSIFLPLERRWEKTFFKNPSEEKKTKKKQQAFEMEFVFSGAANIPPSPFPLLHAFTSNQPFPFPLPLPPPKKEPSVKVAKNFLDSLLICLLLLP